MQEPGTVIAIRGKVTTQNTTLAQGDLVQVGDIITTTNRAFAIIQLKDGSKLTVRPNSKILVQTFYYNEAVADAAQIDLIEGGLRIVTGAIAKTDPENYKVKTPVALMGVRGTEFSIYLIGDEGIYTEEGSTLNYNIKWD